MSTANFVEQLYSNFLGRTPAEAETTYWVEQIDNNILNAAQITQFFIDSPEFSESVSSILKLFYTALGRTPNPDGLAYWLEQYHQGDSLEHITASIVNSDEFQNNFASLDNGDFIEQLYQVAFNRSADQEGKDAWLDAMENGLTRAEMVQLFAASDELSYYKDSEIKVLLDYYGILNIRPSQEEIDAALTENNPQSLITQLYADERYTGETVPGLSSDGVVVDGYISGATVFIDANGDGVLNEGEVSTTTDEFGNFDFGPNAGFGQLVMTGGTDISTGQLFEGTMTAPGGSTVVNPLTSLVDSVIQSSGMTPEQATNTVLNLLGLPNNINLLNFDPLAAVSNPDNTSEQAAAAVAIHGAAIKLNLIVSQIGALLSGSGAADSEEDAIEATYSALGELLSSADGNPIDLSDSNFIQGLIDQSGQNAGASSEEMDEVAALVDDASQTITNLNDAVDDTIENGSGTDVLTDLAAIQIVAEEVEDEMKSGAESGDVSSTTDSTEGDSFDNAVDDAGNSVGDVDGDGEDDGEEDSSNNNGTSTGGDSSATPAFVLSSSSPTDDALSIALDSEITLTFTRDIQAGNGDIYLTNGSTDIRNIGITDSQITISGNTLTINPTDDLYANTNYWVEIGDAVIQDTTGNNFSGITDSTTLNFQTVAAAIELSDIEQDSNPLGYVVKGTLADDEAGLTVDIAGDVNGDGLDDLIVSSRVDHVDGTSISATYVAFGQTSGSSLELSDLEAGSAGFVINGINTAEESGTSVSGAGDVNGDGLVDIVVGDPVLGRSYLIFGKTDTNAVELSDINNGTGGFVVNGGSFVDQVGLSVSDAGDVNADGLDDLIVGAPASDANLNDKSGATFVVYGKTDTSTVDLGNIEVGNNTDGFLIEGVGAGDMSGYSVSKAGDINGDGIDDLIIGAYKDAPNGNNSGASFIVFGNSNASNIELSDVEGGSGGFVINGISEQSQAGHAVSGGGDINGDGLDDVVIGAPWTSTNYESDGSTYVVFGKSDNTAVELSNIATGNGGFVINGSEYEEYNGISLSIADDVNGDGLADILIGTGTNDKNGNASGATYLVYGKTDGIAVEFSDIQSGEGGFTIYGVAEHDLAGMDVSAAGDINGDGFSDILIGAQGAYGNDARSGEAYVVFGGQSNSAQVGTRYTETLTGTSGVDQIIAGDGNDTLLGNGGADVLRGGAGQDILAISDLSFKMLNGGNEDDTLRFDSQLDADLTTLANNKLVSIEIIDLNSTASTLTIGTDDILSMVGAEAANDLRIKGDNTDTLDLSQTAFYQSTETAFVTNVFYDVYLPDSSLGLDESVRLLVEQGMNVSGDLVAPVQLSDVANGDGGFVIHGLDDDDYSGHSVSNAGDVNGDGLDDFIVGATNAGNGDYLGRSYVVFGKTDSNSVELSAIENGSGGFVITNADTEFLYSGYSVSGGGDINGDGLADLVVGTYNTNGDYGKTYVVFGKTDGGAIEISDIANDANSSGFYINGAHDEDYAGKSVSIAGDVNGDGLADIIIGANNTPDYGGGYLVFGKSDGSSVELSDVASGDGGFFIDSFSTSSSLGLNVSDAGDINGDGLADLLISSQSANNGKGATYVVFGQTDTSAVEISNVHNEIGSAGFAIHGVDNMDASGHSISSAGDVNGDGLDDVIIGAIGADPNGNRSGASYVVFGKSDNTSVQLSDIEAGSASGFVINGATDSDRSGSSVGSVGDVNGDGLDDLIIGADGATSNGAAYVVYGKTDTTAIELSALEDMSDDSGFAIYGGNYGGAAGGAVSSAGDVDGDGFDDLLIGNSGAGSNGLDNNGVSYVVWGGQGKSVTIGTSSEDILTGTSSAEQMIAGLASDILIGNGGADVLRGGGGDDILAISDTSFSILDGGNGSDTLRFDAALALDLRTVADNKLTSIENIDLSHDGGDSTLSLDILEILNLTAGQTASNTLVINGVSGDTVNLYDANNGQTGNWSDAGGGVYEFTATGIGIIGTVTIDTDITVNMM